VKDFRGTEIEVGDIVVYPGTASSSCWLTEAEVLGLEMMKGSYGRPDYETLRVRSIRQVHGYGNPRPNVGGKGVLLKVPGRVCVVEKA
jgi:hypothetical protein